MACDHNSTCVYVAHRYGPAAPAPRPDGDAMLAAAIAADSGRGGGSAADPFAGTGIKFKEVKTVRSCQESH